MAAEVESEPKPLYSLRLLLDSPSNGALTFSARGHAECSLCRGRGSVRELQQNRGISAANVLGSAAVSGPRLLLVALFRSCTV